MFLLNKKVCFGEKIYFFGYILIYDLKVWFYIFLGNIYLWIVLKVFNN